MQRKKPVIQITAKFNEMEASGKQNMLHCLKIKGHVIFQTTQIDPVLPIIWTNT